MSMTNISTSSPNFGSLVSLVCSLIIGGNFKFAQLFYDSKKIDVSLIGKIKCLEQVSWSGIDVNSAISKWNYDKRTDQTIQIIFPDLCSMANFRRNKDHDIYHRLFVFIADDMKISELREIFEYGKKGIISTQGSLLLIYDSKNQETEVYLFPDTMDITPIYVHKGNAVESPFKMESIFKKTFGKFDQRWLIGTGPAPIGQDCSPGGEDRDPLLIAFRFFSNLYFTRMKMDFIKEIIVKCGGAGEEFVERSVRHAVKPIYNELSIGTNPLHNVTV